LQVVSATRGRCDSHLAGANKTKGRWWTPAAPQFLRQRVYKTPTGWRQSPTQVLNNSCHRAGQRLGIEGPGDGCRRTFGSLPAIDDVGARWSRQHLPPSAYRTPATGGASAMFLLPAFVLPMMTEGSGPIDRIVWPRGEHIEATSFGGIFLG
jgi:hypothetical protein